MIATPTQFAAAMRSHLKLCRVKARVRVTPGLPSIQVTTPTFEARFTAEEITVFAMAAINMGCTLVRGMPIVLAHEILMTGRNTWEFYPPARA